MVVNDPIKDHKLTYEPAHGVHRPCSTQEHKPLGDHDVCELYFVGRLIECDSSLGKGFSYTFTELNTSMTLVGPDVPQRISPSSNPNHLTSP